MLVLGGESRIFEKTLVNMELAYSKNDINTFSDLDSDDDVGFAAKTGIEQTFIKTKNRYFGANINYRNNFV